MKISDKFKKLQEEEALLIVTGKQDAVFYHIKDGEMLKLDAFKIPTPRYSDNEGHARMRGRGEMVATSFTPELEDRDIIKTFISEFKERLKKLPESAQSVYLFAPEHTKNAVREALPPSLSSKIKKEVWGNYYHFSPQDLLEKLNL